jgi:hypothetical protein
MAEESRVAKAFKEPVNMIGLASFVSASAATLSVVPLLAGLVAEAAYLLFLPDSKWYHDKLEARKAAVEQARKDALRRDVLPMLRPEMEARYLRLEKMRADIAGQTVEGESWFKDLVGKLDYLLEKFLLFARSDVQFRSYLRSVLDGIQGVNPSPPPRVSGGIQVHDKRSRKGNGRTEESRSLADFDLSPSDYSHRWVTESVEKIETHYAKEIESLQQELEAEEDPNTRAVLEKRSDVLHRRQEHVGKIGKILTNLNHQLELLEDSFGLINDQIRARSPEQILADVDEMVWQTDTMTQVLEEIAPYEQLIARL